MNPKILDAIDQIAAMDTPHQRRINMLDGVSRALTAAGDAYIEEIAKANVKAARLLREEILENHRMDCKPASEIMTSYERYARMK